MGIEVRHWANNKVIFRSCEVISTMGASILTHQFLSPNSLNLNCVLSVKFSLKAAHYLQKGDKKHYRNASSTSPNVNYVLWRHINLVLAVIGRTFITSFICGPARGP